MPLKSIFWILRALTLSRISKFLYHKIFLINTLFCYKTLFNYLFSIKSKIDEVDSPRTKAFIVIIVERIAIDFYRKRKREKVSDIEEEYKNREVNFSIEDKVCESNLTIALAKLNESYFQVLSLKFQYGFSNKEIANVLNLGEENVYKRIQRARKKLKEILEEMEDGNIE